jgi:hypothetical protein
MSIGDILLNAFVLRIYSAIPSMSTSLNSAFAALVFVVSVLLSIRLEFLVGAGMHSN